MILPDRPTAINRSSVERLAALGRPDGIFPKPPPLNDLLP
jgi:NitT/TauT family transport system substrate-binding protein